MIKLNSIYFSYGKTEFIENLSVEFKKGKLYGIIGPNGCGKSTLLKLMSGILLPKSGNISVKGKDISLYSRKELAKISGLMPQLRPTPDITVFDYVFCGRYPYRNDKNFSHSENIRITNQALKNTDTLNLSERRIPELSGGERQRVYLALLLAQNTDLVLCDEPATHLDIGGNISIMNTLIDIKNQDKCVVAVLHDIVSALRFCDEIIIMEKGAITDFGKPEEIIKHKSIDSVFGVKCTPIPTDNGVNYIFG